MEFDKNLYIEYRRKKSDEAMDDGRFNLGNKRLATACNRIYYAIFYKVSALALKHDFSTSKHKQLMGWFNANFVKNNKISPSLAKVYLKAYKYRQDSDYSDMDIYTYDEIESLLKEAQDFINELETYFE